MQKQQKVIRFGSIKASIGLPNLIENQTESFKWFLQKDVPPAKRKNQGLQNVFLETFPIVSPNDDIELEFNNLKEYEVTNTPRLFKDIFT